MYLRKHLVKLEPAPQRIRSLNLHPTPIQLNPGRQHPPFEEPGQLVYPLASSQLTLPEHVCPLGQHPTSPATPLGVLIHVLPVPQHTSGAPIALQLLVPSGHLNCRFRRTSRMCMRTRNSFGACGRRAEEAWHVPLPKSSIFDLRADSGRASEANIQLSNMNISPSSRLIFLIPTGFSCCSLCFTLNPLFAWTSSSGKYFRCLGRLCGHWSSESADVGVAQSRAMMAGGSDRRLGRYIMNTQV
jgi:hypothetical protein